MGKETRGQSQPTATKSSSNISTENASTAKPSAMPMSIAPSALAEHLDDGWGEEDDAAVSPAKEELAAAALAPAKLPSFGGISSESGIATTVDKVTAPPSKASPKPNSFAAQPRRSTSKSASPLAQGLPAASKSPKAPTPASAASPPEPVTTPQSAPNRAADSEPKPSFANQPQILSVAPLSETSSTEASAVDLPKVLTVRPLSASQSGLPKALSSVAPSSLPPPVDDDGDWDLEAPAPSIAPAPIANAKRTQNGPSVAVTSHPVASEAPAPISEPDVTKPVFDMPIPVEAKRPEPRPSSQPSAAVEPTHEHRVSVASVPGEEPGKRVSVTPRGSQRPLTTSVSPKAASQRPSSSTARVSRPAEDSSASVPVAPPVTETSSSPTQSVIASPQATPSTTSASVAPMDEPVASTVSSAMLHAADAQANSIQTTTSTDDVSVASEEALEKAVNLPSVSVETGQQEKASRHAPANVALPESIDEAQPKASVVHLHSASRAVEVSEAQTSMSPLVAADTDEHTGAPKRGAKLWRFVAAAAVIVGAIWGVAGAKRAAAPKPPPAVVATPKPEAEKPEAKAVDVAPVAQDVPAPTASSQPLVTPPSTNEPGKPAEEAAPVKPEANNTKTEPASDVDVVKVKVEVIPTDSTVALWGKEVEGPLVFDVKKGTRTILEVARPGYVTRRIVLDGKKPFMRIMMTPTQKPKAPATNGDVPATASPAEKPATAPPSAANDTPTEP